MSGEVFDGWAIVEVMGHQVVAGLCDHVRVAGTDMLRVTPPHESPAPDAPPEILGAAAIFRITPCTEEHIRETIRRRYAPPAPQLIGARHDGEPDGTMEWDEWRIDGDADDEGDS